ncbi:MAG: hypothetical protein ACRYG4_28905 [Janthinobacterium lividum]
MTISSALATLAASAPVVGAPAPVIGGRIVAYDGLTLEAAGVDLAVGRSARSDRPGLPPRSSASATGAAS